MVPCIILQCLLLSYISGQATARSFPSFRLSPRVPVMKSFKFNMKPFKFEMKPLKFDSTLLRRGAKLNFDEDAFKPLLKTENPVSRLGSPVWRKRLKSEIQETNFGGSANNGKLLLPMNDQQLELYNAIKKRLVVRKKKIEIHQKGKNDSPPPTDIHREGSVGKVKESNLDSSKNSGKDLFHKNDQELDLSETNRKKLKVETPDKDKNDHHPHIHLPENSEKTTESFLMSFKQNGGHLSYKNNHELDLSKTSVKGLKEEKSKKVKNDHILQQESSDADDSKKIQNLKQKNNLFSALIHSPGIVISASSHFPRGNVRFYLIIGITIVIILFICFKQCKKTIAKKKLRNNTKI